jgi:hypothetical protein
MNQVRSQKASRCGVFAFLHAKSVSIPLNSGRMYLNRKVQIIVKCKWQYVIAFLGLIPLVFFCCFYLLSGYETLAEWYTGMNNRFYHHEYWKDAFFTIDTKKQGNIFCVLGLAVAIPLQYHLVRRLRKPGELLKTQVSGWDILVAGLCILTGTVAWIWGYSLVHQGFDEVFSAVNCASLPPFQTLSYYMLPNNHILFNVLNGTLFHFAGDKVFTGKLISLVCYWGIIIIVFAWLSGIIKNRLLLFTATVVISLQFPTWGFGFQARGYELYSLAEWFSFFAIVRYINSKNSQWLYYYTLAGVTGYLCIPSFLYFHAACLLFGLFWAIRSGNVDAKFWRAQLIITAVAFLTYLPAICFSGRHALMGNPYVTAQIATAQQFYDQGIDMFGAYLNFYTSQFTKDHAAIDRVLFLAPLALFIFYRNRMAVLGGFFYLGMWLTCIVIAFIMKIYPIDRTMGGHISISLGLAVYFSYLLLQKLTGPLKAALAGNIILIAALIALGIRFGIGNQTNVKAGLYNNDINIKYDLLKREGIDFIPKGSSIAFSDECFYWYYLFKLRGDTISRCMSGNEQYFVRFGLDPLPVSYMHKYVVVKTVFKYKIIAVPYEIYKKK